MNLHQFCIKLEHSSAETIWMTQKALAMGNWWLAASSQQCARSGIMSLEEFFGETSNHPSDSTPIQNRFGTLWLLLLFPKLKSSLKGKRFQTIDEIQENTKGQLMAIRRTMWGPKVPTLKGTEASLSYVQCFLYLISSSINVSFSYCIDGYFLDRLHHIHTHMHIWCVQEVSSNIVGKILTFIEEDIRYKKHCI